MKKEIKIKAKTPIYINSSDTCGNPYRLTPYVRRDGEIWLAAEGNGAGDDFIFPDINAIYKWWMWGELDIDALRADADEIAAAGDPDAADYIRKWADAYVQAFDTIEETIK